MSTRSIIIVTGNDERESTTRIYKHSDGYPTANLKIINDAIERSIRIQSEYNVRFKDSRRIAAQALADLIIGESANIYGSGAYIEESFDCKFNKKQLGNQEDLEWIYIVDVSRKTVNIYGGHYTGKSPQIAYENGFADPRKYVKQLIVQAQTKELKSINDSMQSIEAWGFKINHGTIKKTKGKSK